MFFEAYFWKFECDENLWICFLSRNLNLNSIFYKILSGFHKIWTKFFINVHVCIPFYLLFFHSFLIVRLSQLLCWPTPFFCKFRNSTDNFLWAEFFWCLPWVYWCLEMDTPCLLDEIDLSSRLLYFRACCPQEQLLTVIYCRDTCSARHSSKCSKDFIGTLKSCMGVLEFQRSFTGIGRILFPPSLWRNACHGCVLCNSLK